MHFLIYILPEYNRVQSPRKYVPPQNKERSLKCIGAWAYFQGFTVLIFKVILIILACMIRLLFTQNNYFFYFRFFFFFCFFFFFSCPQANVFRSKDIAIISSSRKVSAYCDCLSFEKIFIFLNIFKSEFKFHWSKCLSNSTVNL